MGYLLKEALKTLCGVNQWAYAVFWKFGCQNPKLLIWEDCYYESRLPNLQDFGEGLNLHSDRVHLLVNKMMVDNHFNLVGEGLVGRAAVTGNHQWILSGNFYLQEHPPEVLKDVCQQFAAGIQTIAVIPALPHGIVQFGSFSTITENLGFVKNVASLILELGYVSGALLSEDIIEHDAKIGVPECPWNSISGGSSFKSSAINPTFSSDIVNYDRNSNSARSNIISPPVNFDLSATNQSSADMWTDQNASGYIPMPFLDGLSSSSLNTEQQIFPDGNLNPGYASGMDSFSYGNVAQNHPLLKNVNSTNMCKEEMDRDMIWAPDGHKRKFDDRISLIDNFKCDDSYAPHKSGDDLFDVLGADFKNKLFSCSRDPNSFPSESSGMYCTSRGTLDSGIFSSSGTDNLLEAVVNKVHPSMDDNISCGTTLTGTSRATGNPGEMSSCSLITGASKDESGGYSQGSSIYGSQISLWIQKNQKMKQNNSVSTGFSKKPEMSKTTRRRLKPGENPRPRPKDRQMIQDRVKELREIVPNGAKCSIDSLLERTIKHMLFLQSVTKHVDKLKQPGESKIISKDGGLLLKDNFEGGATWAYEVGSQSMVCPIIVEDLNQPRQMLVEMLCEERGLFLEIADIIRGLGLTILKGVMETRNDKIWARFAVEANRDVTRMEIFLSLVRLLQQSSKTGITQHNVASNENYPMSGHQYQQGTSITVPAGSCCVE